MPASDVRATAGTGDHYGNPVQFIVTGVKDVTGHAQWLSNAWVNSAAT